VTNRMLARLGVIYGQPDSPDPVAYLEEMSRMLSRYSESVLDQAADLVLKTHRGRNWPTPAECIRACEDVLETDRAKEARKAGTVENYPEWSVRAIERANTLIQSPLGRQAAREGWISPLWDYCRHAGKLPDNEAAIHRCKVIAREFDEAYAEVCAGKGYGPLLSALKRLGDSMLERRDKLADIALGKDTAEAA